MFSIILLVCILVVGQLNAQQQICYPYTTAGGVASFYTCKERYVIQCGSTTNMGGQVTTPVDCALAEGGVFGGGIASTNLCYPNQETLNICGPTPPCPSSGSYPITNRGNGCKSYYTCMETNAGGVIGYKVNVEVCQGTTNYNPSTKLCEETYKCVPTTTPTSTSPSTTTTGTTCSYLHKTEEDLTSCRKYRKCFLGQWRSMTCPFNMRYNTTLRLCMPAFSVSCGSRPTG